MLRMLTKKDLKKLQDIAATMHRCRNYLFITGAGISAESGIPTYRGIGGLYNGEDAEDGLPIESVLSGLMLQARPELTWKYLYQMESHCRGATFNQAHSILAEWEERFPSVHIFTQNIDGFHLKAGSRNVIEIHGNLNDLYCTSVSCNYRESVESYIHLVSIPPACPRCAALLRPDVVLFGETLSQKKINQLRDIMLEGIDMIFSIGTTSVFAYISQPVQWASRHGIPTIEINPAVSNVSEIVDFKITAGAVEALEGIKKSLK